MPRLRTLGFGARLGFICMIMVLYGGLAASAMHLLWHYENRDGLEGMSMDDLRGAYHGVTSGSPLLAALQDGHPDTLDDRERDLLLDWLNGDAASVSTNFDNFDLGDDAPAEIIARECLQCHSNMVDDLDGVGAGLSLDYWDDIQPIAFSREVLPTDTAVLAASTHAHALSLGTMAIVVAFLALMTSWPRWLVSFGIFLMGAGLLVDIASWWLARENVAFVYGVAIGGFVYNGMTGLLLLGTTLDLLLPPPREAAE